MCLCWKRRVYNIMAPSPNTGYTKSAILLAECPAHGGKLEL
jgi:hypothetical protein